jgi:hypothetical protein
MPRTTDPPVSEVQRRAMGAAMSGHSTLGIPASVGKESIEADPGGKLPERSKDVEKIEPASGPMSTKGPTGTSEGLPKAAEQTSEVPKVTAPRDSKPAMSLDEIKAMSRRIGRY